MDNNILNTLDNIRQQTSLLNRVAFVFHCWMPFNNLNTDGFRIPAIQSAKIPRLELLPIVSLPVRMFDSIRNPNTNKFMPVIQTHTRPIDASYSIITQRYGKFGFIMIPELDTDLETAPNYIRYFQAIMRPFFDQGGKIQDLPEYFGVDSPVKEIFDKRTIRVKTTARHELDNLFRGGLIPEADYHKFLAAMQRFGQSAITAHRLALLPGYGILQESITAVNEKNKSRFDEVDEFLIREFPDFDSSSRLTRQKAQDSTKELADVFREFLQAQAGNKQPAPPAPPVVTLQDLVASSESPEADETDRVPGESFATVKCMAVTAKGAACQQDARPGFKSCVNQAHQKQMGEFVDTVNA